MTRFYYANATADAGYQAGLNDKRSADVAVGAFNPVPTTLAATSADGAAFDLGEYTAGDVTVQVKNQNGGNFNPADTEDVQYFWQITPFAGGPDPGAGRHCDHHRRGRRRCARRAGRR